MTIGEKIRMVRKQAGLKQYELAHKIGVHKGHISHIENGHRGYEGKARACNISMNQFCRNIDWDLEENNKAELCKGSARVVWRLHLFAASS